MASPKFKKIVDYTPEELEEAILDAQKLAGTDAFWTMCKGIDAYFEKRKRKENAETQKQHLQDWSHFDKTRK